MNIIPVTGFIQTCAICMDIKKAFIYQTQYQTNNSK